MIVLGGASNRTLSVENAAYRPRTRRWHVVPRAPVPLWGDAIWTGREVLKWRGPKAGAAYDPNRKTWRPLPRAPIRGRSEHSLVWTGREAIVWGGESCVDGCHRADGVAYTPP